MILVLENFDGVKKIGHYEVGELRVAKDITGGGDGSPVLGDSFPQGHGNGPSSCESEQKSEDGNRPRGALKADAEEKHNDGDRISDHLRH